jgi:hypothetical protein
MRSKLINMRGPTIKPVLFLAFMVACCVLLALTASVADKWRDTKQSNIDLSLCPLCNRSVSR